jgi:hypothetical protein
MKWTSNHLKGKNNMSKELDILSADLQKAQRQVEILCGGFNVRLAPSWGELVNGILADVRVWEKTGKLPRDLCTSPWVFYLKAINAVTADTLPPILFSQFKTKFLAVVTDFVFPAIKKYRSGNSDLDVAVFKPLLEVKIK